MMIMKGRRTKRPRQLSPLTLTAASTSSNTIQTTATTANTGIYSNASPATSAEFIYSTEEEEDMANCLILLAESGVPTSSLPPFATSCHALYQCKTCDRCFSSFQALGGHRASHKKPRILGGTNNGEEKKQFSGIAEDKPKDIDLSLRISSEQRISTKSKVHECRLCWTEFSSGQALGGHMRRHRPIPATNSGREMKKLRNIQTLDLNLPAPQDDHKELRFGFVPKEQVAVFSPPPLVDFHY